MGSEVAEVIAVMSKLPHPGDSAVSAETDRCQYESVRTWFHAKERRHFHRRGIRVRMIWSSSPA